MDGWMDLDARNGEMWEILIWVVHGSFVWLRLVVFFMCKGTNRSDAQKWAVISDVRVRINGQKRNGAAKHRSDWGGFSLYTHNPSAFIAPITLAKLMNFKFLLSVFCAVGQKYPSAFWKGKNPECAILLSWKVNCAHLFDQFTPFFAVDTILVHKPGSYNLTVIIKYLAWLANMAL